MHSLCKQKGRLPPAQQLSRSCPVPASDRHLPCHRLGTFWRLQCSESRRLGCDAHDVFLIFHRELYHQDVYSQLQPDTNGRFYSYEDSCELFDYLLSPPPLDRPPHPPDPTHS
jgi:hypothetical protein